MPQPDAIDPSDVLEPEVMTLVEAIRALDAEKAKMEKALLKLLVDRAVRLISQNRDKVNT